MPDAFHNSVLTKCEIAAKNYLDANAYTVNPSLANYRGANSTNVTTPRAVVSCTEGEDVMKDGTWDCFLDVTVISNANDKTGDDHHAVAGEVFARFKTASIAADLSAATDSFTVQRVLTETENRRNQGDEWQTTMRVKLIGCVGQAGV